MRIEICGGIAAGKTTLARSLGTMGLPCVLEDFSNIPSLSDFYADSERYGFETELFFLLQHVYQARKGLQLDGCIICDYSLEQDYAYANNNLHGTAKDVFASVYKESLAQIKKPDLLICLQCEPEILRERILERGREDERFISVEYLQNTVVQVYRRLKEQPAPVIYLDSDRYDFRDVEATESIVLPKINRFI